MVSPHDPRYQHLITRLKKARKDAQLSQEEVAEHLGIHQPLVSRIERGERKIDPIELQILCELYERPATYFVKGLPV